MAFRALSSFAGSEGAETIGAIAENRMDVSTAVGAGLQQACGDAQGCRIGNRIVINGATTSAEMAIRLTHEGTHVLMDESSPVEEVAAWNRALNVHDRFAPIIGRTPYYGAFSAQRQADPLGFNRRIREGARKMNP
jgi:hypothetical protein